MNSKSDDRCPPIIDRMRRNRLSWAKCEPDLAVAPTVGSSRSGRGCCLCSCYNCRRRSRNLCPKVDGKAHLFVCLMMAVVSLFVYVSICQWISCVGSGVASCGGGAAVVSLVELSCRRCCRCRDSPTESTVCEFSAAATAATTNRRPIRWPLATTLLCRPSAAATCNSRRRTRTTTTATAAAAPALAMAQYLSQKRRRNKQRHPTSDVWFCWRWRPFGWVLLDGIEKIRVCLFCGLLACVVVCLSFFLSFAVRPVGRDTREAVAVDSPFQRPTLPNPIQPVCCRFPFEPDHPIKVVHNHCERPIARCKV